MSYFFKLFTLECDAYDNGLVVVLFQDEHPISFIDKCNFGNNLSTSTYEKEMMTILHIVQKWWPSLLENPFSIKTDHQSLKYFLEQWVSSPTQHEWVLKLRDYDYKKAQECGGFSFPHIRCPCFSFSYFYASSNLVTLSSARLCQ